MKDNGRTMSWTEKVPFPGVMAEVTQVIIKMTRSTDMAFMYGLMVGALKVCGKTENRMEKENI